ncbi:MAG: 3-deoxy-D-manno-octulosonic acid transferase [Phycisphaerales bacterium]
MGLLIDAAYLSAAAFASPGLMPHLARRGNLVMDWGARLGDGIRLPEARSPRILLHGVSVGEVNACRTMVELLAAGEGDASIELVFASTTSTGLRRAIDLFEPRHPVEQYPLDLSRAVGRFLDRVRPDLVATVELEVWPNLVEACRRRGIPVVVVNGRLSARSFRGYRRVRPLVAPMFRGLTRVLAQEESYASRFEALGVPRDRIETTGNLKWDSARIEDRVEGAEALAEAMGIDRSRPLVVAGSTAPEEHALLERAVPSDVQLLCAPRRPEWCDAAATVLRGCARRSRGDRGSETGRFLLDTLGELRQAYALADVVVVGRSFGSLFGSDPVEPIALGKPTVIGPAVADFASAVEGLVAAGGLVQCGPESLAARVGELLRSPSRRHEIAEAGRAEIRRRQGASARTAAVMRALARERWIRRVRSADDPNRTHV